MTETVVDQLLARAAAAEEAHKWIEAVALYEVALVRSPDNMYRRCSVRCRRLRAPMAITPRAVVFLTRADRTANPARADIAGSPW